jgi:hypothetical protein
LNDITAGGVSTVLPAVFCFNEHSAYLEKMQATASGLILCSGDNDISKNRLKTASFYDILISEKHAESEARYEPCKDDI